ncbi:MAG TPA: hypothetical protein PLD93_05385 [Synergistaceae bacterium]|nr:hypothetical protein [Synergistaceae bacterium]
MNGKWEIYKSDENNVHYIGDDEGPIGEIYGRENAQIVIAALEMLETLEDVYTDIFLHENDRRHTKIRKVIEKAKGAS